jgi:eukaryotic-like serine/threonine-protein kinase
MQQLTRTGFLVGSPIYMSPEQCSAHGLDERSDIYSLGCVMYEVVTGSPPFSDEVATGILYKHMTELPELIDQSNSKFPLPIGLDAVIFKCLAKQKEDR